MRAVAVIPARYAATRFPGKPLVPVLGKPLVAWVVEAAQQAVGLSGVWVATDHQGIARAAELAGAGVVMTSERCHSGTDRVAEAASQIEADIYINLQGDEPLIAAADIGALAAALASDPGLPMATLARAPRDAAEVFSPDVVKVVTDREDNALYFSRAPIPFFRDAWRAAEGRSHLPAAPATVRIHLGLYGFTRAALGAFTALPPGNLERAECLEQLRALEAGWKIRVLPAVGDSVGVDCPEDVQRVERRLQQR